MDGFDLVSLKVALVGAVLAVFVVYERLRPAAGGPLLVRLGRASRAGWRRLGRNLGLFGLNALLAPLVVLPITIWAAGFEAGLRPAWWQGPAGMALDLALLDLWLYWWHRANHRLPFLWRFHSVHHLDQALDTTSALRFHAGEVVLSALARAPVIVLLDLPLASVLLFEAAALAATIFHHSDARLPARLEAALSRAIVTPSIHWVHHHAIRADTDSNYGTLLSVWDRLFRSASRTRRWPAMPIGIDGIAGDRPLWRLLTAPLWRCASRDRRPQ
jgi:sterol desaturase/sphingolipid hydroxylase (fatty acid hydroxylase superfamily)